MPLSRLTPLLVALACVTTVLAEAQTLRLSGAVAESSSGAPVEFATVMLARVSDSTMAAGTTTDLDGAFALEADGAPGDFYLELSFIGLETKRLATLPDAGPNGAVDVGTVELAAEGLALDEVVVRAEASEMTFRLDKRVFNVGQDLTSAGANALEVLEQVPSVTVDIEGNVALRGASGVQILINGKPSVLTNEGTNALGTLTAEMIERVEVITNPSAKYDAEGTAGIINVVLRKDERRGLNGAISLNGGWPHNHSLGLSVNRRTERFNLFGQLGVGYRSLPSDVIDENRDLTRGTFVRSTGEEFRNEQFYNVVLGTDYHPTERDVITVTGNFAYEIEDQPSALDFAAGEIGGAATSRWTRREETEATNPKAQYEVQWKRDFEAADEAKRTRRAQGEGGMEPSGGSRGGGGFAGSPSGMGAPDRDHSLLISVVGSYFAKDQSSMFENRTVEGGVDRSGLQETRTDFGEAETTLKLDYVRPVGERAAVELGGQYLVNDVANDFAVFGSGVGGALEVDPDLTNVFEWDQRVAAAYATYGIERGRLGVKGGMRLEHTDLTTVLQTTGQANATDYLNAFPSAHASLRLSERASLQAGYSRRIFRPRLWDLNPFFNIRNNFSYRAGNPDLGPELTDSYEATGIYIFDKASLNGSLYHRRTTDLVERVTRFEGDVAITQPFNVGTERATGVEFNGKYTPGKGVSFRGDLNYGAFAREGQYLGQSFDFSGDRWTGRLSAKLKLPSEFEVEATGQFRSAQPTIQGRVSGQEWLDIGVRQPFLGGRGALNLSVRDVFASRIRESFVDLPESESYSFSQRGRFITLGVSYGFGKGDTMEYLGQRRR